MCESSSNPCRNLEKMWNISFLLGRIIDFKGIALIPLQVIPPHIFISAGCLVEIILQVTFSESLLYYSWNTSSWQFYNSFPINVFMAEHLSLRILHPYNLPLGPVLSSFPGKQHLLKSNLHINAVSVQSSRLFS